MGKPLVVLLGGVEIPLDLSRVERSDLYGRIEVEALDAKGRPCTLVTLADDGKTLIGTAGTAQAMLTPEGSWIEKSQLIPTDHEGKVVKPVASSYAAPLPLADTATIDEFLSHNIRSVYQIGSDADLSALLKDLKAGTIYRFPYSFRGGLEADVGFLLMAADGTAFLTVGTPTQMPFVGLEESVALTEDESEDDGEIDFSMM
ncbi:MAG: hypothetical protein K2X32_14900 [Phycisphaerales bacterium]|nr:hypothetical protein [Phycisphaerales bacterium]